MCKSVQNPSLDHLFMFLYMRRRLNIKHMLKNIIMEMTVLRIVCEISEICENMKSTRLYSVQNQEEEPGNESKDTRRVG